MKKQYSININYSLLAGVILFMILLAVLFRCFLKTDSVNVSFEALRWQGKIAVTEVKDEKAIVDVLRYPHTISQNGLPQSLALYKVLLNKEGKNEIYFISDAGEIFTSNGKELYANYRLLSVLKKYTDKLERKSPYGKLMTWTEARQIFNMYAKGTIEDLDSGLRFEVQRRGGTEHADVQPLKSGDTNIMKEIYGGVWSWHRRAVVVEVNNYRIAASMDGMPHGSGAIKKNNFDGHFCLHFLNSKTHNYGQTIDMAHQMMVYKSAGRLPELLRKATPEEICIMFFTALNQHAPDIALLTLVNDPKFNVQNFLERNKETTAVSLEIIRYQEKMNTVWAKIYLENIDNKTNIRKELEIKMVHENNCWWKIDPRSINAVLEY